MNPNKFYERTKLFNDIIYEINKVESKYCSDLNVLNIRLSEIIEEHKQAVNQKLNTENHKKDTKKPKNSKEDDNKEGKKNSSKNNHFPCKEENPMIDKLISEGVQNLLTFYKTKHKLVSQQVSKLGVLLYQFTSSQKKYEPEDSIIMENQANEFDSTYLKLLSVKRTYFKKMCELELYLHEIEKDKKLLNSNNKIFSNDNKEKEKDKINKNKKDKGENDDNNFSEKEKIEEIIKLRQNYKKYLIRLTRYQKEYIDKINEISNEIQIFNIDENNLLFNLLKSFEENYLAILKEINTFCLLYEHNKKLIKDLNFELGNTIIYDDRIYQNYQFEEYVPRFKNIKDQVDMSVIQKMSELIGFEFDKIKTNNTNKEVNSDENINYQNIDNYFLFILLMNKLTGGEEPLNQKEKKMMINLFNEDKYIREFLFKLNKIRMNSNIFNKKEKFDILIEFFNSIFSKISLTSEHTHELIKIIMILSETYFIKEQEKKIFLISCINIPEAIKDSDFWIKYLQFEIDIESKKYDKKKHSRYEYIVIISNTTHLNEFFVPKDKIITIVEYFNNKYNFSDEEYEIIKGQLNL